MSDDISSIHSCKRNNFLYSINHWNTKKYLLVKTTVEKLILIGQAYYVYNPINYLFKLKKHATEKPE